MGTWTLVVAVAVFAAIVIWVLRPGATKKDDAAAKQIFRNEDKPKDDHDR
jgi:cytochrome c oxidase cbb3-type subunit 4